MQAQRRIAAKSWASGMLQWVHTIFKERTKKVAKVRRSMQLLKHCLSHSYALP